MEMRVNGMRAKQNRFDVPIFFRGDKKKLIHFKKQKKSIIRHSGLFPLKVGRKKHFNNIFFFFCCQQNTTLTSCEAFAVFKTSIRRLLQIKIAHFFAEILAVIVSFVKPRVGGGKR